MSNALVPYKPRELSFDEVVDHILSELSSGRSVSSILREDANMPPARMFWSRLYRDEELFEKISRARNFGVEAVLEDARHISDTPVMGQEESIEEGPDGRKVKVTRKEMLGHRRLQIETRIKYAQMIAPRKYGPKIDLTSDGEKIGSVADAIAAGNKRLADMEKGE